MLLVVLLLFICNAAAKECISDRQCAPGYACYQGIGCVVLDTSEKTNIIMCHGVRIDTRETPTLQCFSKPCEFDKDRLCPDIKDTDHCYAPPTLFPIDGSSVRRGSPILCVDNQTCVKESGCPPSPTFLSKEEEESLLVTTEIIIEEVGGNDKRNLTIFFVCLTVAVLASIILIAWRASK